MPPIQKNIDFTFPSTYECEWVSEVVDEDIRRYYYSSATLNIGRDGGLVKVHPAIASPWLGSFELGDQRDGIDWLSSTPVQDRLCVVSKGRGYIVSSEVPETWELINVYPVTDVRVIVTRGLLVYASLTDLVAYGYAGVKWHTRRLAWDGLTIEAVTESSILGKYFDIRRDENSSFVVDLETGTDVGGVGQI